jgi:murein DD-endopeptidase MepM/ murein hydrolase activator NlpD
MKKAILIFLTLLAAAYTVVLTQQFFSHPVDLHDHGLQSPMDADRPLSYNAQAPQNGLMHRFSVWDRLATPVIRTMEIPMGSENGGLAYNAQPFGQMNEKRGGPHLGDDWNGIGGSNTDLGDPIYAVADGLVAYVGEPSAGWGKVVILQHRLADGTSMQTMYAHLHEIHVSYGALVGRGCVIGTCGNAQGAYLAHLHYEVRIGDGIDLGRGYGHLLNRKNPQDIQSPLAPSADCPHASPLAIHQASLPSADPQPSPEGGNVESLRNVVQPESQ